MCLHVLYTSFQLIKLTSLSACFHPTDATTLVYFYLINSPDVDNNFVFVSTSAAQYQVPLIANYVVTREVVVNKSLRGSK